MQLPEIDFSSLEIREIGTWPTILRGGVIALGVIAAMIVVYLLVLSGELTELSAAKKQLADKKKDFKDQYTKAVNLDAYKQQMDEMQSAYKEYINELPSESNIPSLIDNLTKAGERNELKINSIKLGDPKLISDFYMTMPLTLDVTGGYHNIGLFINDIAQLPRLVTLNDFTLKPLGEGKNGNLELNIQAQTYWIASAAELSQHKTAEPNAEKGAAAAPAESGAPGSTPAPPGVEHPVTPPNNHGSEPGHGG